MNEPTQREKLILEYILKDGRNLGITQIKLREVECFAIVHLNNDEENYELSPIAIIVNEKIFNMIRHVKQ